MDAPLSVLLRNGTHASATARLMLKTDQFATQMSKAPILQSLPSSDPIIFDMNQIKPAVTISGLVDTIGGDLTNSDIGFWHMEKATVSGPNAAGTGVENQTYYVPYKNYLENILATWAYSDDKLQIEVGDASITEYAISSMADVAYAGRSAAGTVDGAGLASDAAATTFDVSDVSFFYDNDEQLIQIDNEIMKITGISSDTLTITRNEPAGDGATTAAIHADGAQIYALGIVPGSNGYATGGGIYNVAVNQVQFTHFPGEEDRYTFSIQFVGQVRKGIKF